MGSNWVDPREARTDPAHRNTKGNGRGRGGCVGLSIASYFRSAEEGPVGPKGKSEGERNERADDDGTESVLLWAPDRAWLPFFFSTTASAAATVGNLDENTSSEAASSAVGCGIRSRWLPIISETFLIAKVD